MTRTGLVVLSAAFAANVLAAGVGPVLVLTEGRPAHAGVFRAPDGGVASRTASAVVTRMPHGLSIRVWRRLEGSERLLALGSPEDPKRMFGGDTVEVFLAPHADRPEVFYQLAVNPSNVLYRARMFEASWCPRKQIGVRPFVREGEWGADFDIPFGAFGEPPVTEETRWRADFACGTCDWAGVPGRHNALAYGMLCFGGEPQRAHLVDLRRNADGTLLVTHAVLPRPTAGEMAHKRLSDTDLVLNVDGRPASSVRVADGIVDAEAFDLDRYYYSAGPDEKLSYRSRGLGRVHVRIRRLADDAIVAEQDSDGAGTVSLAGVGPGEYALEAAGDRCHTSCQFEVREDKGRIANGPLSVWTVNPRLLAMGKSDGCQVPHYLIQGWQKDLGRIPFKAVFPCRQVSTPVLSLVYDAEKPIYGAEECLGTAKGKSNCLYRMAYETQLKRVVVRSGNGAESHPPMASFYREVYRALKRRYPDRLFTLQVDNSPMARELAESCDVFEFASWSCSYYEHPLQSLSLVLDLAEVFAPSSPVLFWLGASLPDNGRMHTADEFNTAVRTCILRGMAGNVFHLGHGGLPESRTRIWSFLRGCEDAINDWYPEWAKGTAVDVGVVCEEGVQCAARQTASAVLVLAVNLSPREQSFKILDPATGKVRRVKLTGFGSVLLKCGEPLEKHCGMGVVFYSPGTAPRTATRRVDLL